MITPEEILSQMSRPSIWANRVPTYTSKNPLGFNYLDPQSEDVHPLDITYGLAGTYRYGGQSSPRVTVAEHSTLVSIIIERLWGDKVAALAGGLHDSCEAYGHDIQATIRGSLALKLPNGEIISWSEQDRRINKAVFKGLGQDPALLDDPRVKAADLLGASFERRDCLRFQGDWGLPAIPPEIADLRMKFRNNFV